MSQVTQLLQARRQGDEQATANLLPLPLLQSVVIVCPW